MAIVRRSSSWQTAYCGRIVKQQLAYRTSKLMSSHEFLEKSHSHLHAAQHLV
jgi:hypothetical protein